MIAIEAFIDCLNNRDHDYFYFTVAILDRFPAVLSVHLEQKLLIEHEILLSGGNALSTTKITIINKSSYYSPFDTNSI
jgi:hypothetical protein